LFPSKEGSSGKTLGASGECSDIPPVSIPEQMKLKVIIHEAEEGGYWEEVPAIPGCMTQGETMKDLIENLSDAIEGCLSIDMKEVRMESRDTVMELAV
jgi:predicted RNase H-like HicB family nuclease